MHVLYIHQYFTTPSLGGGTRSYEFAVRLARNGHRVTMLTGSALTPDELAEIPDGIKVLTSSTRYDNSFSSKQRAWSFGKFAIKAIRLGWNVRPDVILASSTPLTVGIPAMALSFRHGVPFVFEVRDLWPEAPIQMGAIRNNIMIRLLRSFERVIYSRAAHIIALSPGMREGVIATGVPHNKVTMIPNAADLSLFHPGAVDLAFLYDRKLPIKQSIAYAGTLGQANAVDLLAKTAIRLQELGQAVQILVAGTGRHYNYLRQIIEKHGLTTMVLLGHISKFDVVRLYRACSAGLVMFSDIPILQTNSPNKFFDLLAAGRPIVTNMRGWVADLVRNHGIGYVAEGHDVGGLSEAIMSVVSLSDVDFTRMAGNARQLAEKQFSRDLLAQRFEEVLRRASGFD